MANGGRTTRFRTGILESIILLEFSQRKVKNNGEKNEKKEKKCIIKKINNDNTVRDFLEDLSGAGAGEGGGTGSGCRS